LIVIKKIVYFLATRQHKLFRIGFHYYGIQQIKCCIN